jgi:hypothetical protein
MKLYQTCSRDWEGDDSSQCIAANSHEEAVDILIETSARGHASTPDGLVDDFYAEDLLDTREWLWVYDDQGDPVEHVAVCELRMPSKPEYVDYCDERVIEFDVEEVLKRRGVIAPDFNLNDCEDDQDAEREED